MSKRSYTKYTSDKLISQINPKNADLWRRYINGNRQLNSTTKKGYLNDINQFFVYILMNCGNKYLFDLDTEDATNLLDDYVTFCISVLGNSDRRIMRRISVVSSMYSYHIRKVKVNPVDMIQRPQIEKGEYVQLRTFLSLEQINMIRQRLTQLNNTQLTLFFELGLYTMARSDVLSNIKVEQIDFLNNEIFNIVVKKGKEVDLCFDDNCKRLIREWLNEREEKGFKSEYLFVSKKNSHAGKPMEATWISTIGGFAKYKNLQCNDLRHSGSDLRYKSGMPLETLSDALYYSGALADEDFYEQINKQQFKEAMNMYKV